MRRGPHRITPRGENLTGLAIPGQGRGSPPRSRGERTTGRRLGQQHRLTRSVWRPSADHPRARGENRTRPGRDAGLGGSPPRSRGEHQRGQHDRDRRRDHPRARGENGAGGVGTRGRPGSPPRSRGERRGDVDDRVLGGITPALAGRTLPTTSAREPAPDHPRARGENESMFLPVVSERGSPARSRGEPEQRPARVGLPGITPALAGRTHTRCSETCANPDHPRARGENERITRLAYHILGSPPRSRGEQSDAG